MIRRPSGAARPPVLQHPARRLPQPTGRPAYPRSSGLTPGPALPLPAASPAFGASLPPRRRAPARSPVVAPALALAGLVILGGASFWGISLLGLDADGGVLGAPRGSLAGVALGVPEGSGEPITIPTSDPEDAEPTLDATLDTPPPDERPTIAGSVLLARGGEIWSASGLELTKLTSGASDSSPTWSPDGQTVYFTRTQVKGVKNSCAGGKYTFYLPNLMRMAADGSRRKQVHGALIKRPGCQWFSHVLQPDVSPDGRTIAVVSDGPSGTGPVVLHTLPARGGRLQSLRVRSTDDLGHNDPAWSPDGQRLAYTHNRAEGTEGTPQVGIYDRRSRRANLLRRGYANPSWSPDGAWIAAERTTTSGRDIVILDPRSGAERVALTRGGNSFAPAVSPAGDQIAYLRREGLGIDLRIMTLAFDDDGRITLTDDRAVTDDGSIDAGSPPAWHIPAEELPQDLAPTGPALDAGPASGDEDALDLTQP